MKHSLCIDSMEFVQTIRDASIYSAKNSDTGNLDNVFLTVIPKVKKLSIMACDGLGYYERRLTFVQARGQTKPSLPGKEMRLALTPSDIAMLTRFVPNRISGSITIETDDAKQTNGCYAVTITISNGASTTFFSKADLEIPDLSGIKANAEKGKKKAPVLSALHIPVKEMLRAGKVFPGKGGFAQLFTSKGAKQGFMALLECKTEETDISVIFMVNDSLENAA